MKRETSKPGSAGAAAIAVAAAGVGLLTGLAARAGARGVMVAAEPLSGHWLDIVKADHLIIADLIERALATRGTAKARRTMLLGRIKEAFVRHAVEEEHVIYPALVFAGQAEASARLAAEHAAVKTALFELERTDVEDPVWRTRLAALKDRLDAHMSEEEDQIFPELRRGLSPEEDARLTRLINIEGRRFA